MKTTMARGKKLRNFWDQDMFALFRVRKSLFEQESFEVLTQLNGKIAMNFRLGIALE